MQGLAVVGQCHYALGPVQSINTINSRGSTGHALVCHEPGACTFTSRKTRSLLYLDAARIFSSLDLFLHRVYL